MEKIIIKNFGGLKDAEIILNKVNVFIGKQASGKSVTAKLIYFFKSIIVDIFEEFININQDIKEKNRSSFYNTPKERDTLQPFSLPFFKTFKERDQSFLEIFEDYFPSHTWSEKPFEITYYVNKNEYIMHR